MTSRSEPRQVRRARAGRWHGDAAPSRCPTAPQAVPGAPGPNSTFCFCHDPGKAKELAEAQRPGGIRLTPRSISACGSNYGQVGVVGWDVSRLPALGAALTPDRRVGVPEARAARRVAGADSRGPAGDAAEGCRTRRDRPAACGPEAVLRS